MVIYIYIYMCVCMCMCVYIYIYIYDDFALVKLWTHGNLQDNFGKDGSVKASHLSDTTMYAIKQLLHVSGVDSGVMYACCHSD